MTASEHRLPAGTRPTSYTTELWVDPAKADFRGRVRIGLTTEAPTNEVVLHARGLEVQHAELGALEADALEPDTETETVRLVFPEAVAPGTHTLTIDYTGPVRTDMAGLYLSKDGDEICLATQCEATDARSILPCFDEPAFKATFAWRIHAPREEVVLANGPLQACEDDPDDAGQRVWDFGATPPISSYLVAFAVGRFGSTETIETRGTPLTVHALAGKERYGVHARDFAAELLAWYEDYFDTPYPFSHYDQVAVPSFSFGAMENPGLVVFRTSLLLLDPKTASWSDEKAVDLVVAHEFAHMWFGNLVTMAWWDDLWLNEAFAEWIAHKAVDALRPSHEVWLPFQDRAAGAMSTDALESTHAIYHPVKSPAAAAEMFDSITYGKGSATMNMLEHYLGADTFRAGLRTYMQAFAHDNARGRDLWEHLGKASDQDVGAIMHSWVTQPGHPEVTVAVADDGKGRGEGEGNVKTGGKRPHVRRLTLTQARAKASPDALDHSEQLWHVPLVLRYQDQESIKTQRFLLTTKEATVTLEDAVGDVHWVNANADGTGFYRTAYDDALRARLVANYLHLSAAERKDLLRDQWALVRAGAPLTPFLDLLDTTTRLDDHYAVTGLVAGILRGLETRLETQDDAAALASYRDWVAARYRSLYKELDIGETRSEDPRQGQLKAAVLRAVAGIGRDAEALGTAHRIAAVEREDPADVDATVAGTAVAVTAAHADAAHYDVHLDTYHRRKAAAASPQEVERYLYTLAAPRDAALVERTLGLLADGTVPAQSVGPILRMMLTEPHAGTQAWHYVRDHWDQVRNELGEAWTAILVEACGEAPLRHADEIREFLAANLDGHAVQAHGRAKERLDERLALDARITPELVAWAKTLEVTAPTQ